MRIRNLCAAAALMVLVWSPAAQAETGYVTHDDIVFKGTVSRVEEDRIQLKTASGPRLWISPAADFLVDGEELEVGSLQVGDRVTVAIDGGDSAVLRLNGRTITLQSQDGPVEVPLALLGEGTLAGTRVNMRLPDGRRQVVSLRRAVDLVRGSGAGLVAVASPQRVEPVASAGDEFDDSLAAGPTSGTVTSAPAEVDEVSAVEAPSTGLQTGLGTLSASSTAPSAGLGTMSTSSTGTQVGVGTLNASGSDSAPVDDVVLRGSDAATMTPVGHLNLTATQVLGTLVEADDTQVVLQTASGSRLSVPAHFRVVGLEGARQNDSGEVDIAIDLPDDSGPIVAVGAGTVSVQLSSGLVTLPLDLLPDAATTDTRVYVEMANGSTQIMNLGDALLQIRLGYAEFEVR